MKSMIWAIGASAPLAIAGVASAQESLAYWAFNNDPLPGGGFGYQPGDFPAFADFGTQAGAARVTVNGGLTGDTIVNGNGDTVFQWIQSFGGSTVNAQFGADTGGSLAVQGGTSNGNNGSFIEIAFDASAYENILFSFAGRRTGTGFTDVDIDAYDGNTFLGNIFSDLNLTSGSTLELISLSTSLLNNVADARIRLTLNGATGTTGNVRLDNFFIQADPKSGVIPTPGAVALFGLAGLTAARRRRA